MPSRAFIAACRDHLRGALISIVIGVGIGCVYALGHRGGWTEILVSGAVVGLTIYVIIATLETLFDRPLARASRGVALLGHSALFLVGGTSGWLLGVWLANQMLGGDLAAPDLLKKPALSFMFTTGAIVIVVGLTFHAFNTMQRRLIEREWAEKEFELARSIQTRLLPPQHIDGDGFAIEARNLPAHVVAGDFYDFVRLDDGSIVIVVGDVAGKGMGASLIMASVKAVLPFVARGSISDAMAMLSAKLVQELDRREFVALLFARYFPGDGMLHVANAGCPDPYVIRDGTATPIVVPGVRLPLGVRNDERYDVATLHLAAGDRVLFLSDGIPEAPRTNGEPLGYEEMERVITSTTGVPRGAAWLDALLANVRARVNQRLDDDWTAVVLDVR